MEELLEAAVTEFRLGFIMRRVVTGRCCGNNRLYLGLECGHIIITLPGEVTEMKPCYKCWTETALPAATTNPFDL